MSLALAFMLTVISQRACQVTLTFPSALQPSWREPCLEDMSASLPWCQLKRPPLTLETAAELWNTRQRRHQLPQFDLIKATTERGLGKFQNKCTSPSLHSLFLKTRVGSQQALVLFVGTELNGGVRDDPHHGGRVSPPQTEEAILQVGAVDQLVGLLHTDTLMLELNFSLQRP